jgi:1,4-alpha-glucan branching enzyme
LGYLNAVHPFDVPKIIEEKTAFFFWRNVMHVTMSSTGYFTFVLHSHLPYVLHHGKWPHGSDWISEAIAECYLPILAMMRRLEADTIHTRISIDFTPILLEQLAHPDLEKIFIAYCDEKIHLAEKDHELFFSTGEMHLRPLANHWREFYSECKRAFLHDHHSDLVGAFRHFADIGMLDAMTSAATHGYLPLLGSEQHVRDQINIGIKTHQKYFGKLPRGIWLPECAYKPGVENILAEFDLEYFIVEGSLVRGGYPLGSYFNLFESRIYRHPEPIIRTVNERLLSDIYAVRSTDEPMTGKNPVVFTRDRKTSEQVWSADIGYPGDPAYLEFHKKHHNSGLRYWAVTGRGVDIGEKVVYDPLHARERVTSHADHFTSLVADSLAEHYHIKGYPGIVCSPFDTELFGHWWMEGVDFLEAVIRRLDSKNITLTDCAEYLDLRTEPIEVIALPEGSWGEGGGHYVWNNENVAWMWMPIHQAEKLYADIRSRSVDSALMKRVLRQLARELLLLESSDWQFIITTDNAPEYARRRFAEHREKFETLADIAESIIAGKKISKQDRTLLEEYEDVDEVFDDAIIEEMIVPMVHS